MKSRSLLQANILAIVGSKSIEGIWSSSYPKEEIGDRRSRGAKESMVSGSLKRCLIQKRVERT